MVKVTVYFVDGSLQDFDEPSSIIDQLEELRDEGLTGKRLIHALFTDDWGPPPSGITITGTLDDGSSVNESIPYD